jgi:hypothetical protein
MALVLPGWAPGRRDEAIGVLLSRGEETAMLIIAQMFYLSTGKRIFGVWCVPKEGRSVCLPMQVVGNALLHPYLWGCMALESDFL